MPRARDRIELARHLDTAFSATPVHMFVGAMRAPNAPIINRKLNYLLPEPEFIEHLRKVRARASAAVRRPPPPAHHLWPRAACRAHAHARYCPT